MQAWRPKEQYRRKYERAHQIDAGRRFAPKRIGNEAKHGQGCSTLYTITEDVESARQHLR